MSPPDTEANAVDVPAEANTTEAVAVQLGWSPPATGG
jgi:hypothetical protein